MKIEKIKQYWETADENMSHLSPDYVNRVGYKIWENNFLKKIDFSNMIVLDYGIGGGYLGKLLFEECKIKKYIGIDISQRQLDFAKKLLENTNSEFYLVPVNLKDITFDIFICQAVIQHFPDKNYLDNFLKNVNNCKCKYLIIQIRHSDETKFRNNYDNVEDIRLSCVTNKKYINEHLSNYRIIYESAIQHKSKYHFLIYETKTK